MTTTDVPAPMTVTAVNWIAGLIEAHREQLNEISSRPVAPWALASEAEAAHTAGLTQTHQRVLATLYEGHYHASTLDTVANVPPEILGGWFGSVIEPVTADLRAHDARKDLPTPEGAYSHAAASILSEFEENMKVGQDLHIAGHFGIPIPSHHFGDFDGRDAAVERVFSAAIAHYIEGIDHSGDPEIAQRHFVAKEVLNEWHAHASFATYRNAPVPDYMTRTEGVEPHAFAQLPDPTRFAEHPDIAHCATAHATAHAAEHTEHHRGLER